ncbi:ATP-binding protein [Streptomyces pinistramenti]|uniref:ATP-binding protein n=1 Tax=Streptomyces pinistramenti TaxID=2884812 RepID=UPI001D08F19C|nr:ATP-binding protein [Streptomyces pinistramenti]MCB5910873.1 ATP-binding protein [Streptomyces pinistramenti]
MDPNTQRGSEENGERAPAAESAAPAFGGKQTGPDEPVRVVRLISGSYLVTVNPLDGSEIEPCPPGERPADPGKLGPEERADVTRAAAPPVPPGAPVYAGHTAALEERGEETERLVRLLSRGRSVRLTGPSGAGRTRLLDAVAHACADIAPDGVVRLSGYHRTPNDLLYALFAAVHRAPRHRPDRAELLRLLGGIGAIVVVDDIEFGGRALDELLDATPECAFLFSATPDTAAPSTDSHVEEVFLGGIGRAACLRLLERAVQRPLTDDESAWAADLWFESEGLPLRFVQAAALLRRRDRQRSAPGALDDGYGLFAEPADGADDGTGPAEPADVPLPTVAEAASPAPLLAGHLGRAARETLRFAVALGGELPHQAHLPALTQDTHADAALGDLLGCGLITPAGTHYRLAATVQEQLEAAGYGEGAAARAHTAAQHYAWWAGHPSVTPERAAAESDAVLAAMGMLTGSRESGHASAAVLLARTAAPAFAAALHWSAWERSLRHGQEAARLAGEVAEEAYFHHELGVLALCTDSLDRARAELEAAIGLRGVLSDRSGAVAGRRALALVADRTRAVPPITLTPPAAGERATVTTVPAARPSGPEHPGPATPAAGTTAPTIVVRGPASAVGSPAAAPGGPARHKGATGERPVLGRARRNLVAIGAGVLLAAVLGTVVTLGFTSGDDKHPGGRISTEQSAAPDDQGQESPADTPGTGSGLLPTEAASASGTPGAENSPSPSASAPATSDSPTDPSTAPTDPTTTPTGGPTDPTDEPTDPTHKPTGRPTDPTPTDDPTDEPTSPTPTGEPTGKPTTESPSQTASRPMNTSSAGYTTPAGTGPSGSASSDADPSGSAPATSGEGTPAG